MKIQSAFARRTLAGLGSVFLGLVICVAPLARGADAPMPDVIVVGAGLSGLTTANDLIRAGKTVLVLEATGRIGGRANTDATFAASKAQGVTRWLHGIDLGAGWIHGADQNPLRALVDEMG